MKVMRIPELDGPYRPSRRQYLISFILHAIAIVLIGFILAYAVTGMTGALDEPEQPLVLSCVSCAGGVR